MASLAAITPAELQRRIGADKAAAVIAYLRANPQALVEEQPGSLQLARTRLDESLAAYAAGDRKGALSAVPDDLVGALVLHGSPARVRERLAEYVAGGVRTPVISLVPAPGTDPIAAIRALGPDSKEESWS